MELLHNWTLEAYKGFGGTAVEETFWQARLPQLAFTYPFLIHSILAISSLRLARVSTTRKEHYLITAANHQDMALPAYRLAIVDVNGNTTEEKGHAMVAFATLTTVYALLRPRPPESHISAGRQEIDRLTEAFSLLQGARVVLEAVGHSLGGYIMAAQVQPVPDEIDFSLNPEDDRLVSLEISILQTCEISTQVLNNTDMDISSALYILRRSFAALYLPIDPVGIKRAINIWAESVSPAYLATLNNLQPPALVVLAHWGVLLKRAEMYWYLEGSAERLVSTIYDLLDKMWKPLITWPLQVAYGLH